MLVTQVPKGDLLSVLGVALCGALASELCALFVLSRDPTNKETKREAMQAAERLDAMRMALPKGSLKLKAAEEALTKRQQKLNAGRLKAAAVSGLLYMAILPAVKSLFDGLVVARLPFVPIWMFKRLAHQGLGGGDFTECSMMFLYLLSLAAIRANLQHILGTATLKKQPVPGSAAGAFSSFL